MGLFDSVYNKIADAVASRIIGESGRAVATARAYREGRQPSQLRVTPGQFDDNVTLNEAGLIVDRTVSQLIGKGISFDFEDESTEADATEKTPQEILVKGTMDANHEEILFHRAALAAAESGTGYLFLQPAGIVGEDGAVYTRIVNMDPAFVTMDTLPNDWEIVTCYTVKYKMIDERGKEYAWKRVIRREMESVQEMWTITDYESRDNMGGQWNMVGQMDWPYPFSPMLHWQNLPTISSPYGRPDLTQDVMDLQDKINFANSNINKIIRFYAHPQRFSKFFPPKNDASGSTTADVGPDRMPNFNNENGGLFQLPADADLANAILHANNLKAEIHDITRSVDLNSLKDKLGQITNFGLRVLYQDNLSKIDTKRELMGDMLADLCRRLQIIAGMPPLHVDVEWEDILPINEVEQQTAVTADLAAGLISVETARDIRGYDNEREKMRIEEEKQGQQDIGTALLSAFNQGK
jgi:hypothetical protein